MAADEFVRTFASDRSHMRTPSGHWTATPPAGPPIRAGGEAMNLTRFVDVETPYLGEVLDLPGLLARLGDGDPP